MESKDVGFGKAIIPKFLRKRTPREAEVDQRSKALKRHILQSEEINEEVGQVPLSEMHSAKVSGRIAERTRHEHAGFRISEELPPSVVKQVHAAGKKTPHR